MSQNNFVHINDILLELMDQLLPIINTLGPQGNTMFINKFSITLTKDGATVLKSIHHNNLFINSLLNFIKDNINKLSHSSGDGTTSTIVIFHSMIKYYLTIASSINNINHVINGINIAMDYINTQWIKITLPIDINNTEILQLIGKTSTNGNEKFGKLLTKALKTVGLYGIVNIEKSFNLNEEIIEEYSMGLNWNTGYINSHFVLNHGIINQFIEYGNPYIFISNKYLYIPEDILEQLIEYCINHKRPLIIITKDIQNDLLNYFIKLHQGKFLNCCVIKFDDDIVFLEDLSFMTGGNIWQNQGVNNNIEYYLGTAEKIIIKNKQTIIFANQPKNFYEYCNKIKSEIIDHSQSYQNKLTQQRVAKLSGGVCTLWIGGLNESEKDEVKDRLTDGLFSMKSALQDGVTLGGGISFLILHILLKDFMKNHLWKNNDELLGVEILSHSLLSILKQLINDFDHQDIIVEQLINYHQKIFNEHNYMNHKDLLLGFDGISQSISNLWDLGIINGKTIDFWSLKTAVNLGCHIMKSKFIINDN